MIVLNKFVYKNCLLLKDTELLLKDGVTVVRGSNLDRKNNSENGVGKTLAFTLFTGLIVQEQLWASQGVRNTNKSIVSKGFDFDASLDINGVPYNLGYFAKGNSANYRVAKNGKDINLHGIPNQVEYIKKLLPISRDQLYSTFFISAQVDNPLLKGTASRRSEFFESFFDLNFYSILSEEFNKRKFKADQSLREKQLLESQLENQSVDNVDLKTTKQKINDLQLRYEKLSSKLEQANSELRSLSAYKAIAEQIHSNFTAKKLKSAIVDQKAITEELENAYTNSISNVQKLERYEEYKEQKLKLEKKIESLAEYSEPEDYTKLQQSNEKYKAFLARYETYKDKIASNSFVGKTPTESISAIEKHIEKHKNSIAIANQTLLNAKKLEGKAECPTCNQHISSSIIKPLIKQAKEVVQENETLLKQWQKSLSRAKLYEVIPELFDHDIDYYENKGKKIQSKLRKAEDHNNKNKAYTEAKDLLKQLKIVQKPDKTEDVEKIKHELNKAKEVLISLKNDYKLHEKLSEIELDSTNQSNVQDQYNLASKLVEELSPKLSKIQNILQNLTSTYATAQQVQNTVNSLKADIESLESFVKDRQIYQFLAAAYSPKGIRLDHIKSMTKAYIDNLNIYIRFMLDDPPTFSFVLEPNHFDILAERHGIVGDIRSFSKSESSQFLPVSALALLDLMDDKHRFDTICLDEIEAGSSSPEINKYINNFIPLIASKVPKVMLITPLGEELINIPNAHRAIMQCQNKKTTILQT